MSKAKYPGLQAKFDECIKKGFKGKSSVSMNEVIKTINPFYDENDIKDNEQIQDLERNLSNYITRAIDDEVIISLGRKKGYKLVETEATVSGGNIDKDDIQSTIGEKGISKESFLHFPATLLLSSHFKSTVFSLPCKTNNLKSGNPDMFMVRENIKFVIDDEELKLMVS